MTVAVYVFAGIGLASVIGSTGVLLWTAWEDRRIQRRKQHARAQRIDAAVNLFRKELEDAMPKDFR